MRRLQKEIVCSRIHQSLQFRFEYFSVIVSSRVLLPCGVQISVNQFMQKRNLQTIAESQ